MAAETIWRDWLPANYLTKDYFEADQDRTLTIARVTLEKLENPQTRKTNDGIVLHWKEDLPPMVCNKTNARIIQTLTGTPKVAAWAGVRVLVYFDPTIKFGKELVGGLRIRKYPPESETRPETPACQDCGQIVPDYKGVAGHLIAAGYIKKYGEPLCYECGQKRKEVANGQLSPR